MNKIVESIATPMPQANVDTDVIMPKRFLRTITREGLADGTFADLRFDQEGQVRADYILNQEPWSGTNILIVGDNFGCGSSREHAVWGLRQMGIQAIIGTSFAGIFFDNARKNGLALPIVEAHVRDKLLNIAQQGLSMRVDISEKTIAYDGQTHQFTMDKATQVALIEGRDDTLDTLKNADAILAFENRMPEQQKVAVIKSAGQVGERTIKVFPI